MLMFSTVPPRVLADLKKDSVRYVAEHVDAVGFHLANAARSLAAKRDTRRAPAHRVVANHDMLRGAVDAQSIRIAAGLQADGVVITFDVAVLHQHFGGRIDIDSIPCLSLPSMLLRMVTPSTVTFCESADVDGPETRPFQLQSLQIDI